MQRHKNLAHNLYLAASKCSMTATGRNSFSRSCALPSMVFPPPPPLLLGGQVDRRSRRHSRWLGHPLRTGGLSRRSAEGALFLGHDRERLLPSSPPKVYTDTAVGTRTVSPLKTQRCLSTATISFMKHATLTNKRRDTASSPLTMTSTQPGINMLMHVQTPSLRLQRTRWTPVKDERVDAR